MKTQEIKRLFMIIFCFAALSMLSGCIHQPDIGVRHGSGGPRILTLGFDARDYEELTLKLYNSIASSSKMDGKKILALGPISFGPNVKDGLIDVTTLQEKLQTRILKANLCQFSMLVKPHVARDDASGNAALKEAMKVRQLIVEQSKIDNKEDDIQWGGLSAAGYILFGRFSTTPQRKGLQKEITYRFNYKIMECRTGLLIWTDEVQFTKSN